jgi:photosystem II stability/assembly factor-like uncharacterized protein
MHKLLFAFACVGILVGHSFGQGFYSVRSPNGTDVWAVGNGGNIFHSYDGGVTWTTKTQGSGALRSVFSVGTSVWIVGDSGSCYYSANSGDTWTSKTLGTGATLRSIVFANAATGWIAGDNGTILKSTDDGATWNQQVSTTTQRLNKVFFSDAQTGFAVGAVGTFLKTTNGGITWTSVSVNGVTSDLYSVSATGLAVYVAGADGFSYRSLDGGATWTSLDFKIDSKSDVYGVFVGAGRNVAFVGGGGFIRMTFDGGKSYTWGMHPMLARLNDIFFFDDMHGWACSEKNNAVLRTTDGGVTWTLPQGTSVSYQWVNKFSAGSIGNDFVINPWNKDRIYVAMQSTIYMSGDRGETWMPTATISTGGSTWSFYISPKDTNAWIVANSGGGKGVKRSTNRGVTWTTPLMRNFTTYGMPLEMDPDHPDTVLFAAEGTSSGPDGILYRSIDFGATWDTLSRTQFRSPCDVVIVPDSTSIVYVGDGVTGNGLAQLWRSSDGGLTWTSILTQVNSEIPTISISRLRNKDAYATAWSSGGVTRTTNFGTSWPSVATTSATWGTDIAKDDPNLVMYGTYGGSTSYLSTNAGATFIATSLSGSNSAILCYDRATILAHQAGGGVWKYNVTYTVPTTTTQALTLVSPNGGESWARSSVHNITWTLTNVSNVRIDYKTAPDGPWQSIVANTPAVSGSYTWLVPNTPTTQARVRISDAFDATPVDSSDADFSITGSTSVTEQGIPTSFDLAQNYPNPFNPSTMIMFALPKEEFVTLKVYNMIGQQVAILVNENRPAGRYTVEFSHGRDGAALSSGLYVYRLNAGEFVSTRKMLLLK